MTRKIQNPRRSFNRSSYILSGLVLLLSLLIIWPFSRHEQRLALAAGYLLFTFNYVLLAKLYQSLLARLLYGRRKRLSKLPLMLVSALKFFGLIASLYLFLVYWQLPSFYLASGSLLALIVLTGLLILSYLRTPHASQGS